jgi:DNA-binding transcriptional ArsR family regulator
MNMRPLFHPAAEDITVEGILHALSDPVRVQIFSQIAKARTAQTCSALAEVSNRVVPKSTLSQHFKVLRESGLIHSERQGVEMRNTLRCDEINARFPGLLTALVAAFERQMKRDKRRS